MKELELVSKQKFSEVVIADHQEKFEEHLLLKTAAILNTQPEHISNTVQRFLKELEEYKKQLKGMK
ncbi:hypothetical protein ACFL96_10970, partial [Thermoproteota archaeon]